MKLTCVCCVCIYVPRCEILVYDAGDADVSTPLIYIATSGPGQLQLLADGRLIDYSGGMLLATPQDGPAGILPPLGYGVLAFQLSQVVQTARTSICRLIMILQ